MPFGRQFGARSLGHPRFHFDVAAIEAMFREAGRFEGGLNIQVMIHHIGNKLGMCLGLVPSAHDAKGDAHLSSGHEGWNDRMKRPFAPRQ